jgi:hypothetical protein
MKPKLRIASWIYKNLSGKPKEEYIVPGDWLRYEFGEVDPDIDKPMYVAHTSNDGFEIWIAYNTGGKWLTFFDAKTARQLARFIIWEWWGKATWFGLKRRLWYWALRTRLRNADWYQQYRERKAAMSSSSAYRWSSRWLS